MKKVAIFDIDGTVFRSSLLIEFTQALIREGAMPPVTTREFARARAKWLDREGSYEDYIGAVVRAFERRIKGIPNEVFSRVAAEVAAGFEKRVYRYTRDLVRRLKRQNYFVMAISQSPKVILDPFCRKWGFDKVYGRIYEVGGDGRLTGRTAFLDLISEKARVLARAVAKEGLTLRGSVAVGDSEGDISMLQAVERPICFNPNAHLWRTARRRGWPVVVERKDVIYRLDGMARRRVRTR